MIGPKYFGRWRCLWIRDVLQGKGTGGKHFEYRQGPWILVALLTFAGKGRTSGKKKTYPDLFGRWQCLRKTRWVFLQLWDELVPIEMAQKLQC